MNREGKSSEVLVERRGRKSCGREGGGRGGRAGNLERELFQDFDDDGTAAAANTSQQHPPDLVYLRTAHPPRLGEFHTAAPLQRSVRACARHLARRSSSSRGTPRDCHSYPFAKSTYTRMLLRRIRRVVFSSFQKYEKNILEQNKRTMSVLSGVGDMSGEY